MATGLGSAGANTCLDAFFALYPYIKLHIGSPGAAGTTNPAVETTRHLAVMSAASGGSATSSAPSTWPNVAASEDYTHASFWTADTAGTFGGSGLITSAAVTAGDTFQFAAGDIDASFVLAS